MTAIKNIKPGEVFSDAEWARLRKRSDFLGIGMILHAWGIIALAIAMFAIWPNPVTFLLSLMFIGARQLGLAVLMHEAAHGGLSTNLKVNDWLGQWICAAPVGANLANYRDYHLTHHKFAQQAEDPDLILSAPFPVTRKSLRRKIIRDLTGQTFFKQRGNQFSNALGMGIHAHKGAENRAQTAREAIIPFVLTNIVIALVLTLLIGWWAYPVLWLLPLATWNQLVTRLRNIAEHSCLEDSEDPFGVARTTRTNIFERLFIAPYWVGYHCEHHLFMHIPCYRLADAHKALIRNGHEDRMIIDHGYWRVLDQASGKPA